MNLFCFSTKSVIMAKIYFTLWEIIELMDTKSNTKSLMSFRILKEDMDERGIYFTGMSDDEIKKYLYKVNYYFKLASYRKLFDRVGTKYNIEFQDIIEISFIDDRLKRILLKICLEIEHGIRAQVMAFCASQMQIDAYNMVSEFKACHLESYNQFERNWANNIYHEDMHRKRSNNVPIWVFVELCSLGQLLQLVELCYSKYTKPAKKFGLNKANEWGNFIRRIRNTCAHGNVFLIDVTKRTIPASISIQEHASRVNLDKREISFMKLHDLFCTLVLLVEFCPKETIKKNKEELTIIFSELSAFQHRVNSQQLNIAVPILEKMLAILEKGC